MPGAFKWDDPHRTDGPDGWSARFGKLARSSELLSGMVSEMPSGILSEMPSGMLSGMPSGMPSGMLGG